MLPPLKLRPTINFLGQRLARDSQRWLSFTPPRHNLSAEKLPTLTDKHDRFHNYLRISLTERCNLRCTYCMPEEGVPLTPKSDILTTDEILKLAKLFVEQGVTKIRLTGGEPTIRPDIMELMEGLSSLREMGLQSIGITSNGIALKRKLPKLLSLGLTGLNLSLDTLDPFKFQILTRRKGLERVIECLDQAEELGIPQLKLNCVVMRGVNDMEVGDFVQLTEKRNLIVRFIEYMPFDGNKWNDRKMVPYKELLKQLQSRFDGIRKASDDPHDTTKHYQVPGHSGSFGFISSMTEHFCSTCTRLRITADGNLKVCLFGNNEVSLRDLLRDNANDQELIKWISLAVKKKKARHAGMENLAKLKNRPMILIGDRMSQAFPKQLFSLLQPTKYSSSYLKAYSTKKNIPPISLSHIDPETGTAKMVDVGQKLTSQRSATAQARVRLTLLAFDQIRPPGCASPPTYNKKGDVLSVAQIAGIQAAKLTSQLIPLCHPIALDQVHLEFQLNRFADYGEVSILATAKCCGRTGVEMEALTAASVAGLTVFDMCKAVDPKAKISDIRVLKKTGGKSDVDYDG